MSNNIIDSIQLSGITYEIQGSGGGGKAIKGGRGISITTGETADTVSFDLPISAGTGTNSIAEGSNTTASGIFSHAEGNYTTASGHFGSHAEGSNTIASGQYSHAEGNSTQANSISSHAEGYGTSATSYYSHAEGSNTIASGQYSHAEGNSTQANGGSSHAEGNGTTANTSSHAEGFRTIASGNTSHAEGYQTQANGQYSHAEGQLTKANGVVSHAEGFQTITNNSFEHASGQYNVSNKESGGFGNSGSTLFSVGNGTSESARHNAFEIRQNGDIYLSSGGTDILLQDHLGGGGSVTVDTALDSGSTNPVENRVIYNKIDEVEEVTAAGLNALNDKITPTVELTQAEYDTLVSAGTVSADTYYIITDAQAVDLTNYYTKSETNTLLGGKQDTLVSGTNIKTINNESILGSGNIDIQGGSTYTAGRGISIANDTISFNLPISAGTGTNSIAEGHTSNKASGSYSHAEGKGTVASGAWGSHAEGASTTASGSYSHAEGSDTIASGYYSHAEGYYTRASGQSEHASGQYNVSNKASTTWGDSGNTLFSVGNGTSASARHNAFEIRQNGDIYLTKDGQDVKLQDQLGGGGTVDQTIISGSTNAVAGGAVYNKIDEVEQVTAAALNNINDRLSEDEEVTAAGLNAVNDALGGLKLVKLTQTQYNNLQTKDNNTLYVIVD